MYIFLWANTSTQGKIEYSAYAHKDTTYFTTQIRRMARIGSNSAVVRQIARRLCKHLVFSITRAIKS